MGAESNIDIRNLQTDFDVSPVPVQFVSVSHNAFNRTYSDPIALNPLVDTMPQPGRSVFVRLITHGAR